MTETSTRWKNRIVGSGTEAPDQLLANPRNFRIHPAFQQDAMQAVLDEVGWVQEIIVNQRTGFVVDGHLRVTLAQRRGEDVPVKYVDLSDDEEALILAALDPIAALAATDAYALNALLAEIDTDNEALLAFVESISPDPAFAPNLSPTSGYDDIDQDDINREADRQAGQFENDPEYREVICPHCAGRFYLAKE